MAPTASVYWKFGAVVRRHREARGLSRQRLATISGRNLVYIGLVERGVHNATIALASDLARALGTSLGKMIAEAEKIRG